MMIKSRQDILKRTMDNLNYIDKQEKKGEPVYEVTQLVNSFLMTLLQNWDDLETAWPHMRQDGVTWPRITTSEPDQQPRQCMGKIRDALTHGLFVFEEESSGEIIALRLWTCPDLKIVDWHAIISVSNMREMLNCFVKLAGRSALQLPSDKIKGDKCGD